MLVFTIGSFYKTQKYYVGFCGYSMPNPHITQLKTRFPDNFQPTLDTIETWVTPSCVPCPDNGQCGPYSELKCDQDYLITRPWYDLTFGLISSWSVCSLDTIRIWKVEQITKKILTLLAYRNANLDCGLCEDDYLVGLYENELIDIVVRKLKLAADFQSGEFHKLWQKVLPILKAREDLVFLEDDVDEGNQGENGFFVRSLSLSKVSLKCKVKKLFADFVKRFKCWLLSR
ncbi:unnamed protein product [Ambrosiozyma monospora]|uniref:Unnamed protein product n=1 Tax=Ambrosiozyma monospora TaxID=43982 RepID=A0ACB5UAN1_AMBMO|nr:unnamed protein product [Ambrosiozyma monospora]